MVRRSEAQAKTATRAVEDLSVEARRISRVVAELSQLSAADSHALSSVSFNTNTTLIKYTRYSYFDSTKTYERQSVNQQIVPCAKEVTFYLAFVSLSFCRSVCYQLRVRTTDRIFIQNFTRNVAYVDKEEQINFESHSIWIRKFF